MSLTTSAFSWRNEDDVAFIEMNVMGESVNTLKAEFAGELEQILQSILSLPSIKGIVFFSGKSDSFIVGADINLLDGCKSAQEAECLAVAGQKLFATLAQFPLPIVAAIHGACLGGGLELALACQARVISDAPKTQLGLPEVQLGLLPGSGGTQRLPRLVGVITALDMMLKGKPLRAKQALRVGLADDLVPQSILLATAKQMALHPKPRAPLSWWLRLHHSPLGLALIMAQARKKVQSNTLGHYPAPFEILHVVEQGLKQGVEKGLAQEAQRFGVLVASQESKQLRQLFFATQQLKKEQQVLGELQPEQKLLVLGGGLMGGGIAYVSAMRAGYHTLIKDISLQGISNALQYCYSRLQPQVTRRSLSAVGLRQKMSLLSGTLDYQATQAVTFVVEAVFEDLSLKQQMVAEVEAHCAETCIFASNTSSLPIRDIAAKALRPEQVVGLHYFSPADKMPLVEVIGHKFTSAQTLTRAIQLARAQGKTPIVVKDEAGFYVNRILALYLNEAARLLLQGEPIEHIDEALVTFGFPVGPLKLLDEIGLDVGAKIAPILTEHLGSRFTPPPVLALLIGDGRKGKKNRRGFYRYTRHFFQRQPRVDPSVYPLLNIQVSPRGHDAELAEPCVLSLLNEAARCLDEGIIQSARDGDIAAIFGIGFPPFLGGPFRYMDRLGASQVVNRLLVLKDKYGPQFEPCDRLKTMANTQQSFY